MRLCAGNLVWRRVDIVFAVRLIVRCKLRTTAHRCNDRVICARFLAGRKLRLPGIDKFLESVGGGYKVAVNEAGPHVVSVEGLIGERRVALLIVFHSLCIAHETCPLETLAYGIGLYLPPRSVNEAGPHVVSVEGLIGERRVAILIVFHSLCIAHEACPLQTLAYGIGLYLPPRSDHHVNCASSVHFKRLLLHAQQNSLANALFV
ncbi:hypothetical protein MRX96_000798 [Rhipicephalus microplus]